MILKKHQCQRGCIQYVDLHSPITSLASHFQEQGWTMFTFFMATFQHSAANIWIFWCKLTNWQRHITSLDLSTAPQERTSPIALHPKGAQVTEI